MHQELIILQHYYSKNNLNRTHCFLLFILAVTTNINIYILK